MVKTYGVKKYGIFINGEMVEKSFNEFTDIINPATGEVIAQVPVCTKEDVDYAVSVAEEAFKTWGNTSPSQRSKKLLELADIVEANKEKLASLESENVGKPIKYAISDVDLFIDNIRFFAGAARSLQGLNTGEYLENHTSMIRREPIGVIASITPWNYPLAMAGWKIGPALAAGNTVVLKPSELTPLTTLLLAELSKDIFPPGVLNIITGYGEVVGTELAKHKRVKMISLTGSVRAGMAVAREAVSTLKKVHLELGGKAPIIVYDDANINELVESMKVAGFYNSGQDCTAAIRLYVDEKIYDEVVEKLVATVKSIKVGDPLEEGIEMGPVVSESHLNRIADMVNRAKDNANVQILTGGNKIDSAGFYYEPTIIAGVSQSDEVVQQEIFGPVMTIMPFSTVEEAIELANDCQYGLSASVWTQNIDLALKTVKQLEFGAVWTNTHMTLVSEMPHGGSKLSGYGKDMSMYSLEEYTEIKHVMIKTN